MDYITDTDFLPHYKDIHYDTYQLLYGVIVNRQEGKIYDSIITLCRSHREPILRKSKIDFWKQLVDEVIKRLKCYSDSMREVVVYIPYAHLMCSPERLLQRYTYARMILDNVRDLDMNMLIRRNRGSLDDIAHFYPIKPLDELMYSAIPKLSLIHQRGEEEIRKVIENELYKRGIIKESQVSSIYKDDAYKKLFFDDRTLSAIQFNGESKEPESSSTKEDASIIESIGFLYYALHNMCDKVKKSNKDSTEKVVKAATWTIYHGLFHPDEKLDKSHSSGYTYYQYVSKKKFNNQTTKQYVLNNIKQALTNCGIVVPEELSQHFK